MNASTRDDLARLRAIAEQGRNVPLLGGRHLILWGSAMALALLINWGVIERILPWPDWSLAISWFGIVLAAWAASVLIGRVKAGEPGSWSVGNRVERAAWIAVGAFLLILALALFARGALSGDPRAWDLFMTMSPVMFGTYAIALRVSAVAGESPGTNTYAAIALAFAAATAFLIGDPVQYPIAAAGVLLVTIPAGLGHLAAVRKAD